MNKNDPSGSSAMKSWVESAKLQANEYGQKLVRQGELLDPKSFCKRSGMSESELQDTMREGRLFGLEIDDVLYLPAFFAERSLNRDWLEEVTLLMGNLSGTQKWVFFTRPKGSLGGITPLEALRQGRIDAVSISAKGFAER